MKYLEIHKKQVSTCQDSRLKLVWLGTLHVNIKSVQLLHVLMSPYFWQCNYLYVHVSAEGLILVIVVTNLSALLHIEVSDNRPSRMEWLVMYLAHTCSICPKCLRRTNATPYVTIIYLWYSDIVTSAWEL